LLVVKWRNDILKVPPSFCVEVARPARRSEQGMLEEAKLNATFGPERVE
jgi:hypothetical protein